MFVLADLSILERAKPLRALQQVCQPWLPRSTLLRTFAFNFVLLPLAVLNCSVLFPPCSP